MTTSGTPKASHIRTNLAAFSADAESRHPPRRSGLLAMTPTVRPAIRPSAVTTLGAHRGCSSTGLVSASRMAVTTGCTS